MKTAQKAADYEQHDNLWRAAYCLGRETLGLGRHLYRRETGRFGPFHNGIASTQYMHVSHV